MLSCCIPQYSEILQIGLSISVAINSQLTRYNGRHNGYPIEIMRIDAFLPAVVLHGEWKDESVGIDVVTTVREEDCAGYNALS